MKKKKLRKLEAKQNAKLSLQKKGKPGKHQQANQAAGKNKRKHGSKRSDQLAAAAGLPHGYEATQRVLLVGEGNFSFAAALLRLFGGLGAGIVATAFDSEEDVIQKYDEGETPVSSILEELRSGGVTVRFGIDATRLKDCLKANKKKGGLKEEELAFDRIVFNFPHVGLGIKDQDVNVRKNTELLAGFFVSACELLRRDGQVHVALRVGKPYDLWNMVGTAHAATRGILTSKTTYPFNPEQFPGYTHRRTLGFKEGQSQAANEEIQGRSKTYVFRLNLPRGLKGNVIQRV